MKTKARQFHSGVLLDDKINVIQDFRQKLNETFEDFLGYKSEPSSELKLGMGLKPESIPNIVDFGRVKIMLKKLLYDNILSVKSGGKGSGMTFWMGQEVGLVQWPHYSRSCFNLVLNYKIPFRLNKLYNIKSLTRV